MHSCQEKKQWRKTPAEHNGPTYNTTAQDRPLTNGKFLNIFSTFLYLYRIYIHLKVTNDRAWVVRNICHRAYCYSIILYNIHKKNTYTDTGWLKIFQLSQSCWDICLWNFIIFMAIERIWFNGYIIVYIAHIQSLADTLTKSNFAATVVRCASFHV